jgi:hypothetical protein
MKKTIKEKKKRLKEVKKNLLKRKNRITYPIEEEMAEFFEHDRPKSME